YIIHPEEVLADNFRLMVNQTKNAPTPRIPARMKELLSKQAQPSSPSSSRTEAPKAAETSVSRRRKLRTIAGPAQSAEQPRERSGTGGISNCVTGGLDSSASFRTMFTGVKWGWFSLCRTIVPLGRKHLVLGRCSREQGLLYGQIILYAPPQPNDNDV
ncbi:hypothetical protein LCGC14_3154140, partial [marine sediment metagenome]